MYRLLTFYSRMGGKSKIATQIIAMFPDDAKTYVEVFVGAGNLILRMPKGKYEKEIINDKEPVIAQIFHDIQHVSEEDIAMMDFIGDRNKWKTIHATDPTDLPPAQRLYHNLYHIYFSFMGSMKTYGATRVDQSSRVVSLIAKLPYLKERMEGVVVRGDDYAAVIEDYMEDEHAFFYMDPPYHESDVSGYKYGIVDPVHLHSLLEKVRGKWLLSYNDHPLIRALFRKYKIETIETTYVCRRGTKSKKGKKVVELVIRNF